MQSGPVKKHEFFFSLARIPIDFCIMFGAFFIAKEIRLITDLIPGVSLPVQTISTEQLSIFAFFGSTLYISLFALHKLYHLNISYSKIGELMDIIRYGFYWFLFFSVAVYLGNGIIYSGEEIPRLIIAFSFIIAILGSSTIRIFLNILQAYLLKKNIISRRNIALISGISYKELLPILDDIAASNVYSIIGYFNPKEKKHYPIDHYANLEDIKQLLSERRVDEILSIDSDFSKQELYDIWEIAKIYGIRYRYITNNFDVTKSNTELGLIHKTPVIEIRNTPLDNWRRIWKRMFDVFLSIIVLVFGFPLFLIIAVLIKIEDPSGPVIYKNRRIGQHGTIFNCYKFRYLAWKYCIKESYGIDNDSDPALEIEKKLIEKNNSRSGPLYKIKRDPRKTRIGNFLEKYSLDELPQFFNILMGEMSVVGPRPHQPREVEKYEFYQKRLLTVKPGLTGMAQVHGREQNNFEKEAKLDIFYIENWSFLLDCKIMLKTFSIIFNRK